MLGLGLRWGGIWAVRAKGEGGLSYRLRVEV